MDIPRSSMKQGCSLGKGKALILLGVDGSLLFNVILLSSIVHLHYIFVFL